MLPDVIKSIEDLSTKTHRSTVKITMSPRSLARIAEQLKPFRNVPRLFRPGLEEVADYMRNVAIVEVFDREGPGWKPLSRRTVSERIAQGFPGRHPILQRTGDLYDELTNKTHHKHVEVIRTGSQARVEIGGSSKKFIENQMGRKDMNLPRRPMIPGTGNVALPRKHRQEIAKILKESLRDAVNGR